MKISIITVTYNSSATLEHTILSVAAQSYKNVEHIVVDGASSDNTLEVIKRHEDKIAKWVSEPDSGMYDAMNKGIKMATGDVVGILNADDFYAADDILFQVNEVFDNLEVDMLYGDIEFVKGSQLDKVVRTYSAKKWHPERFEWGYMPPHPSVFIRRECFEKYGYYKTDYKIAADYELLIRYLSVERLHYFYLSRVMVRMRTGGKSTKSWKSNITLNEEIIRGCHENGLLTNRFMVYSKYFKKVFELLPSLRGKK